MDRPNVSAEEVVKKYVNVVQANLSVLQRGRFKSKDQQHIKL